MCNHEPTGTILDLLALTAGTTIRPRAPRVPAFSWVVVAGNVYCGWDEGSPFSRAADAGYREHFTRNQ